MASYVQENVYEDNMDEEETEGLYCKGTNISEIRNTPLKIFSTFTMMRSARISDQRKKSVGKISRWTDRRCFVQKSA